MTEIGDQRSEVRSRAGGKTGLAAQVRDLMQRKASRACWTPANVANDLGLPNAMRVREVFRDMLRRGEIERLVRGRYRYVGAQHLNARPSEISSRMLRAMHVMRTFTVREVARLADAKKDYTKKVVRRLCLQEDIRRVGRLPTPTEGWEAVYRIKDPDGFYLRHCLRKT